MSTSEAWELIGLILAFLWNKLTTFEIFGFILWEYAVFGIALSMAGYMAVKIIQRKGGKDIGDSD